MTGGVDNLLPLSISIEVQILLQKQTATYGDHVLGSLELPEGDINGDTTLTLGLELVEHPGCNDAVLRLERGMSA